MSNDRVYTGEIPMVGAQAGAEAGDGDGAGLVHPVYLLADSQLLFWKPDEGEEPWLETVRRRIDAEAPFAAYLSASNGDLPELYDIFTGAMEGVGILPSRCRMIPAEPTVADVEFMNRADLILLAGGDTRRGWEAFVASGMREVVVRRYYEGAALVGVSAGAVQLGVAGWPEEDGADEPAFATWGLVPFVVSAHDEETDWRTLRRVVAERGEGTQGLGISRGGGLVYHPDHTLEAVRHPVFEVESRGGELSTALLFPPAAAERA